VIISTSGLIYALKALLADSIFIIRNEELIKKAIEYEK
tara:strand:- start:171 stop:284 length:114 start_codon:yes stop_codon:yes gene_type:complete